MADYLIDQVQWKFHCSSGGAGTAPHRKDKSGKCEGTNICILNATYQMVSLPRLGSKGDSKSSPSGPQDGHGGGEI